MFPAPTELDRSVLSSTRLLPSLAGRACSILPALVTLVIHYATRKPYADQATFDKQTSLENVFDSSLPLIFVENNHQHNIRRAHARDLWHIRLSPVTRDFIMI